MEFKLSKSGTVTACREALNEKIASLEGPHNAEHAVVRAIAAHIVTDYLDPLHDPWAAQVNAVNETVARGTKMAPPPEPSATINIDCTISFGAK